MSRISEPLQLSCSISDARWPVISIVVQRTSQQGQPAVVREEVQYDLTYGKAEVMVQNMLRPMVEEILRRRKGK